MEADGGNGGTGFVGGLRFGGGGNGGGNIGGWIFDELARELAFIWSLVLKLTWLKALLSDSVIALVSDSSEFWPSKVVFEKKEEAMLTLNIDKILF